jgi:hypothetical protein
LNGISRKLPDDKGEWHDHPTGRRYRYVVVDGRRELEIEPEPCTADEDGTHSRTCFRHRIYIPQPTFDPGRLH